MILLPKAVARLLLPPGLTAAAAVAAGVVAVLLLRTSGRGPLPSARLRSRLRIVAALCLFAGLASYLAATPFMASLAAGGLQGRVPPSEAQQLGLADCIVVLGGGVESYDPAGAGGRIASLSAQSAQRIGKAAGLYRTLRLPVVVSGGSLSPDLPPEALLGARLLQDLGVAPGDILREEASRTTLENALKVAPILRSRGLRRPLLVTSALHMPRAVMAFRRAGVEALPAPAGYVSAGGPYGLWDFLPDAASFAQTGACLWEYLGMLWYGLRAPG